MLQKWWRDRGGEGTSGPQLVCHSLNLLPAAITTDKLGRDQGLIVSLWLKLRKWTPTQQSACFTDWAKVVSLFHWLYISCSSICPFFWLQFVSLLLPLCATPYRYVRACQHASFSFCAPLCMSSHMCVFLLSLQLCETSCVCLLYLVYLLQESKLPAATLLLDMPADRLLSWLWGLLICYMILQTSFVRLGSVHTRFYLFDLFQALSDQLCMLALPAFISWSTCSRRASCQQQSSQATSALSRWETETNIRCVLFRVMICFSSHAWQQKITVCWNIQLCRKHSSLLHAFFF